MLWTAVKERFFVLQHLRPTFLPAEVRHVTFNVHVSHNRVSANKSMYASNMHKTILLYTLHKHTVSG